MRNYTFATSCVNAVSGEDIQEMVDIAEDLSSENFIYRTAKALGIDQNILDSLGYQTWAEQSGSGPKKLFADDFALSCHKSYYQGIPCYYVRHSAIEHVYIPAPERGKLLDKDASLSRYSEIETLREEWDELRESLNASRTPFAKGLAKFASDHRQTLIDYNIPVQSVVSSEPDYVVKVARRIDAKVRSGRGLEAGPGM